MEALPDARYAKAVAAWEAKREGWSQAATAKWLGVSQKTVSNYLRLLPNGQVPPPANIVGSDLPGWAAATELAKVTNCPRCVGILRPEDLCLACRHYPRAEQRISDELRRERAKQARERRAAARFKPKGAEAPAESK
jgi:hypothetical protein